jgi:hypothetical protein
VHTCKIASSFTCPVDRSLQPPIHALPPFNLYLYFELVVCGDHRRDKIHKWLGMLSYVSAGASILAIVNGPWGKFNLGPLGQKVVSAMIVAVQGLVAAPWVGISN